MIRPERHRGPCAGVAGLSLAKRLRSFSDVARHLEKSIVDVGKLRDRFAVFWRCAQVSKWRFEPVARLKNYRYNYGLSGLVTLKSAHCFGLIAVLGSKEMRAKE